MKKLLLFLCSLVATAAMQAQIIHVYPNEDSLYHKIQSGINAATPGDTVLVAEGTYYEQINFKGIKPLMVASQFLMDGDTSHIGKTIIDGSHLTNMDSATVVYFVSGEDTTSILCGFTIQHGKGTYTSTFLERDAGGIWISHSGAKIIHNRITDNILDDTQPVNGKTAFGAGISTDYEEADYWVVLENNIIDHNTAISGDISVGGGGYSTCYNSRVTNNIFSYNSCINTVDGLTQAGGIIAYADPAWVTSIVVILQNNKIKNNVIQTENGLACGAGVELCQGKVIVTDNEVINNHLITSIPDHGYCAGLYDENPRAGSMISRNLFKENSSTDWGGGLNVANSNGSPSTILVENNYFHDNDALYGGGLLIQDQLVILQNNVFNGNHVGSNGGAVYILNSGSLPDVHPVVLINNSFSGNTATNLGGAIYSLGTDPFILNSIFWKDSASSGKEIYTDGGTAEIAYSDIDPDLIYPDYIDGGGSINEDPLFANLETLRTDHSSPCVDAGITEFTCIHGLTFEAPAYDILGNPRPQGAGFDMGAHDMDYWPVGIGRITNYELRITNWPNPFMGSTTLSYTLKESSQVTIQIFNSFGQMVAEPVNTTQAKGEQHAQWDAGSLPAGKYYYRILVGGQVGSGKMVKIQ